MNPFYLLYDTYHNILKKQMSSVNDIV